MSRRIDTNGILDIFQKRELCFADSCRAGHKAIEADTECLISAFAATDIFYSLRKFLQSTEQVKERIEQLFQLVTFADVQEMDTHDTYAVYPGFEDALVDAVAQRNGTSCILTRNIMDFAGSAVPVITPTDFLKQEMRCRCS